MSETSAFERLDQLEELEDALSAALEGIKAAKARLLDELGPHGRWARQEFERLNVNAMEAERAAREAAEAGAERTLELHIRLPDRVRTVRAMLIDAQRERELADLARVGLIDSEGVVMPPPPTPMMVGFSDDGEPGDGEAEPA